LARHCCWPGAAHRGRQVGHRTTLELLNAESDASAAELALTQWRSAAALDRLRLQPLAGALEKAALAAP
jgi:outer membrane protein